MYEILRNISVFWSIIHVIIIFVFLFRSRLKQKTTVILTIIFTLPLISINTLISIFQGTLGIAHMLIFSITIPCLLFFWILSKDRGFRFLFTLSLAATVSFWITIITHLLDYYIMHTGWIMLISRVIIFPAIEYVLWNYIRKPYIEIQESIEHGWGAFIWSGAIYYVLLIIMSSWPVEIYYRPDDLPAFILVLILVPITYISIFLSLYHQLNLFKTKENERNLKNQKAILEMQLDNQYNIRKLHHNIKAYVSTLSALLSDNKYEEAKIHMSSLVNITISHDNFCRNPYINALLCYFLEKFKSAGALLQIDAMACSDENLPHTEICLIVSNALENSLEAISNIKTKYASIKFKRKGVYLIIRVTNSCDPSLFIPSGTIPQSKKLQQWHGFGLPTIFQTAKSLNGTAVCYASDGIFTLDVSLKI